MYVGLDQLAFFITHFALFFFSQISTHFASYYIVPILLFIDHTHACILLYEELLLEKDNGLTKIIPRGYYGCIKIVNIIILVTTVCTQSQTGSVQEAMIIGDH